MNSSKAQESKQKKSKFYSDFRVSDMIQNGFDDNKELKPFIKEMKNFSQSTKVTKTVKKGGKTEVVESYEFHKEADKKVADHMATIPLKNKAGRLVESTLIS